MKTLKEPLFRLPFLFLTLTCTSLAAQQNDLHLSDTSLTSKYERETIYLRFSTYVKDNEAYEIGIIGEVIKHDMMVSPDAMIEFKKYQKQRKWSLVLAGLQLVTQVAAYSTRDKSWRRGLLIGSGAVAIVSIPFYIGSQRNLNKAVWIRNRDVLE